MKNSRPYKQKTRFLSRLARCGRRNRKSQKQSKIDCFSKTIKN